MNKIALEISVAALPAVLVVICLIRTVDFF